ncbi:MAG: hypothetical protein DSZ03_05395, partial [Sulfurimonas sp.]
MTIADPCVTCIINQSLRVADAIDADAALTQQLYDYVREASKNFDFTRSPPEVAAEVYETMARLASKDDLYADVKRLSTAKARQNLPLLHKVLACSDTPFITALKIAVAGNVIDLAAAVNFDLDEELESVFHTPFAIDDTAALQTALYGASSLLYIADNAGEHIFDYVAIETLQRCYPNLHVFYMVRGTPIINDVTLNEA